MRLVCLEGGSPTGGGRIPPGGGRISCLNFEMTEPIANAAGLPLGTVVWESPRGRAKIVVSENERVQLEGSVKHNIGRILRNCFGAKFSSDGSRKWTIENSKWQSLISEPLSSYAFTQLGNIADTLDSLVKVKRNIRLGKYNY